MGLIVGAAQTSAKPGDVPGNVARHVRFCAMAAKHGVQLLVFPELSITGYELGLARANALEPGNPLLSPLREAAAKWGMVVVAGAPEPNGSGGLSLSAFSFFPNGRWAVYRKVHV